MKDFWNQRYSESGFAYGTAPNAYFKSVIDTLPPGRLLVPGAGEGRDAVYAATLGWDVVAFDQSEAGKEKALKIAAEKGVQLRYEVCDVQDFVTTETFDAIACIFFHLPVPLRQAMHVHFMDWLAPKGHIIIEAFTPLQLSYTSGGPKDPSLLMTASMLEAELGWLKVVENEEGLVSLDEGPYHKGEAAVVRYHGVKEERI
jgi:2-polyprenyl-3-methyl-5-hydroxy-6-metoxy-1,4-benzoquinol methylase